MSNGEFRLTFLDIMDILEEIPHGEKFSEKRNDKFRKLAEQFSMTEWLFPEEEMTY